jgi:hypothetical protein
MWVVIVTSGGSGNRNRKRKPQMERGIVVGERERGGVVLAEIVS